MNIFLGIISIFITFSLVVLIERLFEKEGLFVWIGISTIIANILVCKSVDFFGFTTSLGNVMFASNFLATDILCEKYSAKESKKAIILGVVSQLIFVIVTQLAIAYIPSSEDLSHEAMEKLFSINLRVSIASVSMYFFSNMLDIYLYEKIKKIHPNKLWLRNNLSTIISNCLENYIFSMLAFYGIFEIQTILEIATVASVIEMIIALLDTPFLYLSKAKKLFFQAITKFLFGLIIVMALLFIPAGTIFYWNAWILIVLLFVPMFIVGCFLMLKNPKLLEIRLNAKEKEIEQRYVVLFNGIMFIMGFVFAGLNYKYSWFIAPRFLVIIASVLFCIAYILYAEVLRENTYLSRTIEVQEGQKVIDTGLYGIVRHPMYLSTILLFLTMPVILGSYISLVIFLIYPIIISKRIKNEEEVLEKELKGYTEYKEKVKYKLIPYIW